MSSVVLTSIASTRNPGVATIGTDPMAHADADMRHLLDVLAQLKARPIEHCTVTIARAQPTLATALRRLLRNTAAGSDGVSMAQLLLPISPRDLRAHVYRPEHAAPGLPVILYFHGGGFVVGDLERFDATPRALARRVNAIVVAAHYRQAPEFRFPAAHEDARAVWAWLLEHAEALGGDPRRLALVGEDAGANLAVDVAIGARDAGGRQPRHLVLVGPMATTDTGLASYAENAESRPLSAAAVRWLHARHHAAGSTSDPRLNLTERGDFGGLPPTTVILAGMDPLRSEGELLAAALRRCGVWVDATTYDGVTHGFFGLARAVNKAMFAEAQVTHNLRRSLA